MASTIRNAVSAEVHQCAASAASDNCSHVSRRNAMLGSLGTAIITASHGAAAAELPLDSVLETSSSKLMSRAVTMGDVTSPGPSLFSKPSLIECPRWLFGVWDVTSTFETFRTPLGTKYVDEALLLAAQAPADQGGIGSTATFEQRWYSTLPDTFQNQLRVFTGSMPSDAVIQDRAFNLRASTNAYLGFPAVESVEYDTREPGRATVAFAGILPDMGPAPTRRAELYVNNTQSETLVDASGHPTFVASELLRQVLLGVRQADVRDYEVINVYTLQGDGRVTGAQRTCIYLEPRDQLYFNARGRAVAVYDYSLRLERRPPPEDSPAGAVACAPTPKGFVQCL